MKKSAMKKWVKALRSGKYKQGESYLVKYKMHDETGDIVRELSFCCLGVLCQINGVNIAIGVDELLGEDTRLQVGLKTHNGQLNKNYKVPNKYLEGTVSNLADLNDNGLSFKQIANIIEKNYKDL